MCRDLAAFHLLNSRRVDPETDGRFVSFCMLDLVAEPGAETWGIKSKEDPRFQAAFEPGFQFQNRTSFPTTLFIAETKQQCKEIREQLLRRQDYQSLFCEATVHRAFVTNATSRRARAANAYAFECALYGTSVARIRGYPRVHHCRHLSHHRHLLIGLCRTSMFTHTRATHALLLCRCHSDPMGTRSVQNLEGFCFASWDVIDLKVGEPMLLTTRMSESCPNGSPCVITHFSFMSETKVWEHIVNKFEKALPGELARGLAWTPLTFPKAAQAELALQWQNGNVKSVVRKLVSRFLERCRGIGNHSGRVLVPHGWVRMPSGASTTCDFYPTPEIVMHAGHKLVACRVTYPLVPSAVRVASAMLSATVEFGAARVVAHSTSSADTANDRNAHNAALYVAATRVKNMSDLALTEATAMHDNVFKPRLPLRSLVRDMVVYGDAVRVYHCRSPAMDPALEELEPRGDAVHDARLIQQMEAGMFAPPAGHVEELAAALPPED